MNEEAQAGHGRYRVDDLEIEIVQQSVWRNGVELDLPALSFGLLAALVKRAPEQATKDELIREVWGEVVVSDETLAQRVRLLRQALGDDSQNPRYVTSVRGRGYRLACPAIAITQVDTSRRIKRWSIAAVLTAGMLAGLWIVLKAVTPQIESIPADSLAVLPFTDMSSSGDYPHFADGMQEELLSRLSTLEDLQVISRTSVEKYRNSTSAIPVIAQELDADAIIEGSVRISGDKVRITVQLIDGETDRHLWAANYDRELTVANLFAVQEEIAAKISRSLEGEYDSPLSGTLLPTRNLEAYEAYLLGKYHTFRPTPENLAVAVDHLEKATALDREFAEAYVALGWAYSFLGTTYGSKTPEQSFPKAREAALRALALDSNLAEARMLYADILTWYDWDFATAEREHEKARALGIRNSISYALFLSTQQRHAEAIKVVEQRTGTSPNDRWIWVNAAWRYINAGKIELAIDAALRADGHPDAMSVLGAAYLANAQNAAAVRVFEDDLRIQGRQPLQLSNLALAYFRSGQVENGGELLAELQAFAKEAYFSPMLLATVHFAAGHDALGFDFMMEAINKRDREVIFIQVDPKFDAVRNDPRFQSIVESIARNSTASELN